MYRHQVLFSHSCKKVTVMRDITCNVQSRGDHFFVTITFKSEEVFNCRVEISILIARNLKSHWQKFAKCCCLETEHWVRGKGLLSGLFTWEFGFSGIRVSKRIRFISRWHETLSGRPLIMPALYCLFHPLSCPVYSA